MNLKMNRNIIKLSTLLVSLLVFFACSEGDSGSKKNSIANTTGAGGLFTLTSNDFAEGGMIPAVHGQIAQNGCMSRPLGTLNTSPHLAWKNAPSGTKSFVIVMHAPLPNPTFEYWAIINIPTTTSSMEKGDATPKRLLGPTKIPKSAKQYAGSQGLAMYNGPCNQGPQTVLQYVFTIYAMNTANLVPNGQGVNAVIDSVKGIGAGQGNVILGKATLKATYDNN